MNASHGILYAEDFGAPVEVAPAPPPPPAEPVLTQADLDAACIRAVGAAQDAWADSAAERRTEALEAIRGGLQAVHQAAQDHAEATAEEIARTCLSMVAAVLPEFSARHGDNEVRALVQRMMPLLAPRARVVVRVHAALIEALQHDLLALDEGLLPQIELRPANLPSGDVRMAWEDGSLTRDTAAIAAAMQDSLAQLGLIDPDHSLPHRSAALADQYGPV